MRVREQENLAKRTKQEYNIASLFESSICADGSASGIPL